ncbi:hypothetical protein V1478_003952 [Vespula squamosa]|uniref:Uncharacterized protein n=1 Tax=Vespula squamosa TaxID=30214 RepID=A0ABD2BNA6_VESSQ
MERVKQCFYVSAKMNQQPILDIIIVVGMKHKSFSRRLIVRVQEPINNLTNLITTMIVYNVTTFINISVVSGHIRMGYNINEETFNGYPIFSTYLFKQLVKAGKIRKEDSKMDETILYVCTFVRIIELPYSKINPSCRDLVAASLTAMAVSPECRTLITEGSSWLYMSNISLSYGYMRYLHIKRILRRVCVILCSCLLFQILRISTDFVMNRKKRGFRNDKKI